MKVHQFAIAAITTCLLAGCVAETGRDVAQPDIEVGDTGIVQIESDRPYERIVEEGAGIVIAPEGLVLTVFHVVEQANSIDVTIPATGEQYRATVAGFDRRADVALLSLDGARGLATAPLGDSSTVQIGDRVVARGNSAGTGRPLTTWQGEVSGLDEEVNVEGRVQSGFLATDAPVDHGDSGGPLFDAAGKVIGLNAAGDSRTSRHVPLGQAMAIADRIRSGAGSASVHVGPPATLGIGIDTQGYDTLNTNFGVRVRETFADQPAARAGLRTGDVIVAIDGTPVTSWLNLLDLLDGHQPGELVDVTFVDSGLTSRTAPVTLGRGNDGAPGLDLLGPIAS